MKTNQPTLKRPLTRITSIFLGMLTFLMLFSCDNPSADKQKSEKFTIISKLESHILIDSGEEGHSHGDKVIREGSFMDKNNKNDVGRYTLILETVTSPQKSGNSDQTHEDRILTIIFQFNDGSTIIAKGITHYTVGESAIDINTPTVRAIIGGTGKYMGARGQYTVTRTGDSLFEVEFEILL